MKSVLLTAVILLAGLFTGTAQAQTTVVPALQIPSTVRLLGGAAGGDNLGNKFFGLNAALEIPIKTRAEFDLSESFDPYLTHVALGSGIANQAEVGAILWLNHRVGLDGGYESSIYSTPEITKSYLYAKGGLVFRGSLLGKQARFRVQYFQEVNNGIKNGIETDQVKGAAASVDLRFGCFGKVCVRGTEELIYGRALTQGNPVCDGSYGGAITCPRGTALSAGANGSIRFEFPRVKNDTF